MPRLPEHLRLARLYWLSVFEDFFEEHLKPIFVFALVATASFVVFVAVEVPSTLALIVDGANAVDVLGQTDGDLPNPQPIFGKQGLNDSPNQSGKGLNFPIEGVFDALHHRYFLADYFGNRVLVWNLNADDTFPDRAPDFVLGQTDFTTTTAATTQSGMDAPWGVGYDPTGNRLFVSEQNNNRVLIFDVATIANGEAATNVLGQADFVSNAVLTPIPTASSFNGPTDLAYDDAGDRLFVADFANGRVTVFDATAFTNNEAAVRVLGQDNFGFPILSTTQHRMYGPSGLAYDVAGQRLFVSDDSFNNRVMIFDVAVITNGESAVGLLGQPNFSSSSAATTQSGMDGPEGLAYDSANDRLFVVENGNSRVTVWNSATTTPGELAVSVLGQPDFTTSFFNFTPDQHGLRNPFGVALDEVNDRLYVSDTNNARVMVFDVAAVADGEAAVDVLGQPNYTSGNSGGSSPGQGFFNPRDTVFDDVHHRLFVADEANNRVVVYNLNVDNTIPNYVQDAYLGQLDELSSEGMTLAGSVSPSGLAYDSAGDRLFVADAFYNRVMVFDTASIANGENAANVLGQDDFVTVAPQTTIDGLSSPHDVFYASGSNLLYVADTDNSRVMIFDVASITNGENAVDELGQTDGDPTSLANVFTSTGSANAVGYSAPKSGVFDTVHHRFFATDANNNRVLVYNLNPDDTFPDRIADRVLGQPNFTTTTSGTTQSQLSSPWGVTYDAGGDRLFVADRFNHRVMVFDTASITNGENAAHELGQVDFVSSDSPDPPTSASMNTPHGVSYDDANDLLYVVDTTNNRILVFDAAVIADGEAAVDVLGQPNFAGNNPNGTPTADGLNGPEDGMAYDTVNHRFFLSDTFNNRILIYDLNPDDTFPDKTPDHVLGQPDFFSNGFDATTASTMFLPRGLAYDGTKDLLYVVDHNNLRVLVFDVAAIVDGEAAVKVLGQPDFTTVNYNVLTASSLGNVVDVAIDTAGQRLFVSDGVCCGSDAHRRVLVFSVASITNGEAAVNVLGQPNFTSNTIAVTSTGMFGAAGLAYDSAGNRLFVVDEGLSRVMVYNVAAITDGEAALNVLGQPNFTSGLPAASGNNRLNCPEDVTFDPGGNRLFVADACNSRIMVWDVAAITNGEAAVHLYGQPDFSFSAPVPISPTQSSVYHPMGVVYDDVNDRLLVDDTFANRVMIFDAAVIVDNEDAVDVIGQDDFTSGNADNAPSATGFDDPTGLTFDAAHHRAFVTDTGNNRVLAYDLALDDTFPDDTAERVLGQPGFGTFDPATTQSGLSTPIESAYDVVGDRLFVTDSANSRVMVFDTASIANGEAAIKELGQVDFVTAATPNPPTASSLTNEAGVTLLDGRLYVFDTNNNRISIFDVAAITDGEAAVDMLGQDDGVPGSLAPVFTTNGANDGPNAFSLNGPYTIELDAVHHRFFVADSSASRVLVYNLTAGDAFIDKVADAVLGQADFRTSAAATFQDRLSEPRGLLYEASSDRLFVGDYGNHRVVVFDTASIANGENAVNVLGQPDFTTADAGNDGQDQLWNPQGLSYDAAHGELVVADVANQRVMIFDGAAPLPPPSVTVSAPNGGETFTVGASTNITWTNAGTIDHFRILLSTDGGGTFPTTVVASDPTSPFSWTVPNTPTALARIRIQAENALNVVLDTDDSNANFTIATAASGGGGGGIVSPSITLADPDGGESITPGTTFNVFWSVQGLQISNINLTLSSDGGSTYPTTVATALAPASGFYAWSVPPALTPSSTTRMKIEALGPGGSPQASDVSNANFTINNPDGSPPGSGTPPAPVPPPSEEPPGPPPPPPGPPVIDVNVRVGVNEPTPMFTSPQEAPKSGDDVTYVIEVTNIGDSDAGNVVVTDRIPPGTAYDTPSLAIGGTLMSDADDADDASFDPFNRIATFRLGDITPGEMATASIRVTVMPGAQDLVNDVTVSGDGFTTSSEQTTTSVESSTPPTQPPPPQPPTQPPTPEQEPAPTPSPQLPAAQPPLPPEPEPPLQPQPGIDDDGDGLSNDREAAIGTDPQKVDTDGDGLTDRQEDQDTGTDPLNPDTDSDGLTDGEEVETIGTDPLVADTDGEGLFDGREIQVGTDPQNPDTDSDGLDDHEEVDVAGTDPLNPDTDGDGIPDGIDPQRGGTPPSLFSGSEAVAGDGRIDSLAELFARDDSTLKQTPLLDLAASLTKGIPVLGAVTDAVRDAVQAVRASETTQTVNDIIVTPIAAATSAVATTSAVGFAGFARYGLFLITQPLALLDRRRRKAYGTVYNAGSKMPVDLAIVRLLDVKGERQIATRVTDRDGRYLFLVPPGAYRIELRKEGFSFPPSREFASLVDGPYPDVQIANEVASKDGAISKNLPMEPTGDLRPASQVIVDRGRMRFQWALASIGPGVAAVGYVATPKMEQIIALIAHLALAYLFTRLARAKKPKSWGTIRDAAGAPVKQAVVRVVESEYNKILDSQVTDARGRYAFLVGQNRYFLTAERAGFQPLKTEVIDFTKVPEPAFIAKELKLEPSPHVSPPASA